MAKTTTEDEWTIDSEESPIQVKFTEDGDKFTGVKCGSQELTAGDGKTFTVYLFRSVDNEAEDIKDGELCSVAESHKLKALADIADGRFVEITRTKLVDVGRPQPMTDYRIRSRAAKAEEIQASGIAG